jgi:hypothetical protein
MNAGVRMSKNVSTHSFFLSSSSLDDDRTLLLLLLLLPRGIRYSVQIDPFS